jgi:hypothetical protein
MMGEKPGIVESEKITVASQVLGKDVSAATN